MLPPRSVESPCFPIHSVICRFDLTPTNSSVSSILKRVDPPKVAPDSGHRSDQRSAVMGLVLFPCQLGDPTRPIGWPPLSAELCTVAVNDNYVTTGWPRCPVRGASHRTLAGLPLSPYLQRKSDGSICEDAPLKVNIVSHGKWVATLLLAWCSVVDVDTVVQCTVTELMGRYRRQQLGDVSRSLSVSTNLTMASSSSDTTLNLDDPNVDVDSGWVDAVETKCDRACPQGNSAAPRPTGVIVGLENDAGVDEGEALVTLRCPLSYQRMKTAGRGHLCTHLTCFDVGTYIVSCLNSNAWNCPICDGPVFIRDICIDDTLQSALEALDTDVYSVLLLGQGYRQWRSVGSTPCVTAVCRTDKHGMSEEGQTKHVETLADANACDDAECVVNTACA
ncbi:MIZ SP RING zinc finger [Trypanosoma vivax]|uniref:SP-RING-type domain-containing protein n=1 Tax=Trypanosoma vivax (strain Y486) TaxID=1055687 RepID=G0TRY6_TRYVY|nr:hypothetical protein TRVL_03055 [Trypanosoma vivax]KAH8617379.1 MIZ SP RING zinc finger [Trypanosoma vivax]CCC46710.1 conserved hypothetical protein [Trypanosoma vivax Y486]